MHWISRLIAFTAVLTPALPSAALAQRRADVSPERPVVTARRDAKPATQNPDQPAARATTGPKWSFFGGVASGDNPYDMGLAVGGTGRWQQSNWPVAFRGDAYFAHHSGGISEQFGGYDISVNIFGMMGNAEYAFPTQSRLKPYAFGGLGLFYSKVNLDYDGVFDAYDSSTDLGFGIGGGMHLTEKFGLELRFMDLGGFSTIPLLAVWHF